MAQLSGHREFEASLQWIFSFGTSSKRKSTQVRFVMLKIVVPQSLLLFLLWLRNCYNGHSWNWTTGWIFRKRAHGKMHWFFNKSCEYCYLILHFSYAFSLFIIYSDLSKLGAFELYTLYIWTFFHLHIFCAPACFLILFCDIIKL